MRLRPNPPRMVTVVLAIVLLAIGLAGTVVAPETVRDLFQDLPLPRDVEQLAMTLVLDRQIAYACLLGSPMLLVIGSLLPGI